MEYLQRREVNIVSLFLYYIVSLGKKSIDMGTVFTRTALKEKNTMKSYVIFYFIKVKDLLHQNTII